MTRPVSLVRYPEEQARLADLRERHLPRLLMIAAGGDPPPLVRPEEEDWIRLPSDEADLTARIDAVARRAEAAWAEVMPTIDEDGILRSGGRWVHLSGIEARMTARLLERANQVVSTGELGAVGWPDGPVGNPGVVRVHMTRLRRQVGQLGIAIQTIRNTGYILELHAAPGPAAVDPDR